MSSSLPIHFPAAADFVIAAMDKSPSSALLVDYYELTMAYSYWHAGKHEDEVTFEIFFRKCPFGGEYCVFAGLDDAIRLIKDFRISASDADWLKTILFKEADPKFFDYLQSITMEDVTMYAVDEGTPVFPHVPLIQISGPLAKLQLLETALVNSVSYASLVTTNACRFVQAAGGKPIVEFGARKAHGPNGALSASRYSYLGGCISTSNVLASKLYGIPLSGTIAHSFIMSYQSLDDLSEQSTLLKNVSDHAEINFKDLCIKFRQSLDDQVNIPVNRFQIFYLDLHAHFSNHPSPLIL